MESKQNLVSPRFLNRKKSQSGQGLIEYILLLVVAVGVIMGAIYQVNDAVRVWADNYFGDYLACLLETGELPAIGGGSTSGECNQLYKDFNIADGRPRVGSGVGSGSTSDDETAPEEETATAGEGSSSPGSNVSRSTLISAGKSSRLRNNRNRFSARGSGGSSGASSESNDQNSDTGSTAVANIEGYKTGTSVRIPVREPPSLSGGRRIKDKNKDKATKTSVVSKKSEEGSEKRDQLIRIERKTASSEVAPDIEEFSFGNILRWLIIALIIIAIVVVIGGELLQASKSMD